MGCGPAFLDVIDVPRGAEHECGVAPLGDFLQGHLFQQALLANVATYSHIHGAVPCTWLTWEH